VVSTTGMAKSTTIFSRNILASQRLSYTSSTVTSKKWSPLTNYGLFLVASM
jgi:hypothetical protein